MELELLSESEGFLEKKKKIMVGWFYTLGNTWVGHNVEPLMNEYLRKIISDKVTCSPQISRL